MFKSSWNKEEKISTLITKESSSLKMIELDMVHLKIGENIAYSEKDKEYGIIVLGGKCEISGNGFEFKSIGKRKNVFDGAATCVYIPPNKDFLIKGESDVSICVSKAPASSDFEPVLINPEDVIIKDLGKDGWKRQAHFILDQRVSANLLYIGEAYVEGGMWASYPPHKHDQDNMPEEGILEEVYYYEFSKPQGFGIQKVYTKEGDIDETYTVKSGDIIEIPRGYHPFCAAPAYDSYYLWIMAGENRGFFMTTDKAHEWLVTS